ncbi:coenzyme F420-0:L-glutamate ligase [Nocardioides sp. CFH 31398]|uniref:coenzyme F420-0:L-glutamate ligase n=1 Tax=Nocardioides sp. CFH 31398 TaxID=2919579 RepID=UPI001F051A53|nr:coenzyme F420-0:L-glutamate ligase [Nocardioides sp. CFH 31398]MCH1866437.1 coenzyme F420-0:L-glutamate ligase [Nocardioides sp. CFH 31398]
MSGHLHVVAPDGVGEVRAGDDLVALVLDALAGDGEAPVDGDVVVVTSKVVSKAEGRLRPGDRFDGLAEELADERVRVVARRGPTTIVRTRLGLTMAAAGVDASNVPAGHVVLLPDDPDDSARRLRDVIARRTGANVAVVVTDTVGRAWREGQTDLAIGVAGLVVLDDHAGRTDGYGNPLAVTAPAVADEVAGAAELAGGKLAARPFALVRGLERLVLPPGTDGPGARALVRPPGGDLFGYGAREAVVQALAGERGDGGDPTPYGGPASAEEVAAAVATVGCGTPEATTGADGVAHVVVGDADEADRLRLRVLALAHGWTATDDGSVVRLGPPPAGP